MRLIWHLTTPRKLRRNTLLLLIVWTAVAFAHHDGLFEQARNNLPDPSQWHPPTIEQGAPSPNIPAPRTLL